MSCCCWTTVAGVLLVLWLLRKAISYITVSNLQSKTVLVTGCDTGFGRGITNLLSSNKYKMTVLAGCLTDAAVAELSKKERVVAFKLDVTKEQSVADAAELVKKHCKDQGLWGVINNAGLLRAGLAECAPISDLKLQLDVNLVGTAMICKAMIPHVRVTKGRIINVASVAGRFSSPMTAAYNASKFAVEGYTDSLRREMSAWGVGVILIEPGIMKTPLWNVTVSEDEFERNWDRFTEEQKRLYGRKFLEVGRAKSLELINKLAGDPQTVVNAMASAVTSRFPFHRYVVGLDANLLFIPLSFLPSPLGDAIWNVVARSPVPAALQK